MSINLFGLRLTRDAEPELEPSPGIEKEHWVTRLSENELVLDIRLRIKPSHFLTVKGTFQIKPIDVGLWGFASSTNDGVFRLTDTPGWDANPFELKLGWLSVRDRRVRYVPTEEGLLTVDIPQHDLILSRELPINIKVNGGVANLAFAFTPDSGIPIDEGSIPGVVFEKGSLGATTFASVIDARLVREYFSQNWRSDTLTLAFRRSKQWTDLKLGVDEIASQHGIVLPLHAFQWRGTRNVSPSFGAITQYLKLSLSQTDSGCLLTGVEIASGTLRNYAYHDSKRNPLELTFNREIALSIQPLRTPQRIACFLLQSKDPDGVSQSISVTRVNDSLQFMGPRAGMRFPVVKQSKVVVQDEDPIGGPNIPGVDRRLLNNATGPALLPSNLSQIEHAIAGEAYVTQTSKVRTWNMRGSNGLLPLLPDMATERLRAFQARYQYRINESLKNYTDTVEPVTHESNLVQGKVSEQSDVKFNQVLQPNKAPTFNAYDTDYEFGSVRVTHQWNSGSDQDHFLIFADRQEESTITFTEAFQLDPTSNGKQRIRIKQSEPVGIPANEGTIKGCVKLQRGRKLEDLLKEGGAIPAHLGQMMQLLPEVVKGEDWIGVVVFRQYVDFSDFPLLSALVEEDVQLQYLAISPPVAGGTQNQFSVYSRLIYKNENLSEPHPGADDGRGDTSEDQQREVYIQMRSLDLTWADRRLSKFHSETMVRIRSCLGLAKKESEAAKIKPTEINVIGAIDRDTGDIKFLARSNQPVGILPDGGFGPIQQLYLSKVEIVRINNNTKVDIDGDVKLKTQEVEGDTWFDASDGDGIKFKGFGFWFSQLTGGGNWLKFDYPSFQFQPGDGGFSLLRLPFLKVKLKGLGIDFPNSAFSWNSMVQIVEGWKDDWGDVGLRKFAGRFRLGFELSKLPFLSSKPFDALTFDFEIGIPFKDAFSFDESKLRLYLSAVGFNKLNLDLMRFLTVRAESIRLEAKEIDGHNVPWFMFEKVDVQILRKTVIDDLTFAYYTIPNGQRGFIGLVEQDFDKLPFVRVDWILVGKNLSIPSKLAQAAVSVQPSAEDDIREQIKTAYEENKLIPLSVHDKTAIGEWIFAAGIDVLEGFLIGKFIFQDGAYYGISLDGQMMKEWFGWDFAISVLYIQRERPEEDSFYIQIRLPMFSFSAFTFKGGVVALEIQMNGGFLLDVGFPWLDQDGIRNWDRSQGLFISGVMGKGGMYIAKRSSVRVVKNDLNQKLVMFAAGQAAMVGIGGAYSKGPFRVEVYAGIYIVAEGALLFRRASIVGLRLVGAVGIQVRGIGELNWWIISIRIEVVIGAEARLTLRWGIEFNPATGYIADPNGQDPAETIIVQLDFVLYARVSARACIGSGWFKICKGVRAGVSLPYRQKLRIGV